MHDVVVIGAGPAGATAARVLAARGHDVVVLEEHARVGDPVHCTGVLGIDAFDELDLPRETILSVVGSAEFIGTYGQSVVIESDTVRGAVVDRGAFDRALAARAVAAGARVVTGARADRLDISRDAVTVEVAPTSQRVRARACVLACGANYRFNRALGLGVPRLFAQSAQVLVPFPAIPHIQVWLGREIAPAGFAWLVPFRRDAASLARVGLTCDTRARARFHTYASRLARASEVDAEGWPAPRLKMLPLAPVEQTYAPRVLAVGDAAGLLKPTTGGGIYYGLISGSIAGEVLDEALRRDRLGEAELRGYEALWRRRLWPEIRAGIAFRRVASHLTDRAIDALLELARVDGLIPLLKRTAHFNWHRKAALALLRDPSFRRVVLANLLY